MADTAEQITFFKPNGETISFDGEKVDQLGSHPSMGGTVMFMKDNRIVHTNLDYLMVLSQEAVEDLTGDLDVGGEEE